LHNIPQGCGASVASAVESFTTKNYDILHLFLCVSTITYVAMQILTNKIMSASNDHTHTFKCERYEQKCQLKHRRGKYIRKLFLLIVYHEEEIR
jgi:hypothetical protein